MSKCAPPPNRHRFECQKKTDPKTGIVTGCNKTFVSHSPEAVQRMPKIVQQQFDIVKVGRKWVTGRVVHLVRDTVLASTKAAAAVTVLESQHKGKHLEREALYYHSCKYFRTVFPGLREETPPKFPQYNDKAYGGVKITHRLVRAIFALDGRAREPYLDRRMQMQPPGHVIKMDEVRVCL